MTERKWYRFHGVTLIGLCIVCAALAWSECGGGKRVHVYSTGMTASTTVYGWPFTHYNLRGEWWFGPLHRPWWNCRALSLAIQFAAIAAVVFVLETWLRSKNRLQVRLLTLLILTSVLSVVFALAQFEEPTFEGCELDPTAPAMPWPVRIPILFALGCTIYTAGWLVARLARSLYSLVRRTR